MHDRGCIDVHVKAWSWVYVVLAVGATKQLAPSRCTAPLPQSPLSITLLAGMQAKLTALTLQDEQQTGQGQLGNLLTWSPLLQGMAAASLLLAAAILWSTVRRPAAGVQTQRAL